MKNARCARKEIAAYRVQRDAAATARERYAILLDETLCMMRMHPDFDVGQLQEALAISRSALYRILSDLKSQGLVQGGERGHYSPVVGQKVRPFVPVVGR